MGIADGRRRRGVCSVHMRLLLLCWLTLCAVSPLVNADFRSLRSASGSDLQAAGIADVTIKIEEPPVPVTTELADVTIKIEEPPVPATTSEDADVTIPTEEPPIPTTTPIVDATESPKPSTTEVSDVAVQTEEPKTTAQVADMTIKIEEPPVPVTTEVVADVTIKIEEPPVPVTTQVTEDVTIKIEEPPEPATTEVPTTTQIEETLVPVTTQVPEVTTTAPVPVTTIDVAKALQHKKEICSRDYQNYNQVLRLLQVDAKPSVFPLPSATLNSSSELVPQKKTPGTYPRIFCYVNTISPYHKSHAQLVADTWAQRCDKTVFFSNDTGVLYVNKGTPYEVSFDIVKMYAPADYWHLWMKTKEVFKYIYDHYRHDYDWFYKADDDAYVIVDNFRNYLRRPEIVNNHKRQPMQLGKRFNLTADRVNSFIPDVKMKARWWQQWDRWVFNSGGPGYALNRMHLDHFVAAQPKKSCLSAKEAEMLPEDTSASFCLMWEGVVPWDTRDIHGRPRWHSDNPGGSYGSEPVVNQTYWLHEFNQGVGGYRWGDDCCSSESIGFHYVKKGGMHHMERMLYFCRTGDDVPDMATYNRKFNLGISESVLEYTP